MDEDPTIATHRKPAWAERSDFILHAELEAFGMPGKNEQLWARQVGPAEFRLCCIPFFSYGMALGDVVEARQQSGSAWVISGVVSRSGHRNVRLVVQQRDKAQELHEQLHAVVVSTGLAHEWHGAGYLAIDLPREVTLAELMRTFSTFLDSGDVRAEHDE